MVENSNFNEIKQKCKLTCKSMEKMKSDEYSCLIVLTIKSVLEIVNLIKGFPVSITADGV